MKTLLRIEWLKIKNYNAFKFLFIFFAIGTILVNYLVLVFSKNVLSNTGVAQIMGSFNPYSFSNTWQSTSYATGYLLVLPAMLMVILFTNEYTYRTGRQNIIDGWSRQEFIFVKLLIAFILAVTSTFFVVITATSFGLFSGTDFSLNGFSHVGFFFLKALTYNMFAVLIGVLIKKTGFAISIFFIYLVTENFLSQMLDIVSLKLRDHKIIDLGSIGSYLPMNAADGLLTFPDNPLKSFAKRGLPTDYFWVVLCFTIIYLLLFIIWSRRKFIKADL